MFWKEKIFMANVYFSQQNPLNPLKLIDIIKWWPNFENKFKKWWFANFGIIPRSKRENYLKKVIDPGFNYFLHLKRVKNNFFIIILVQLSENFTDYVLHGFLSLICTILWGLFNIIPSFKRFSNVWMENVQ